MEYVARINLKTDTEFRNELIDFCLKSDEQFLAIGWSRIYGENKSLTFSEYYDRIRQDSNRVNTVLNIFKDAVLDDLFWTRDLDGNYWICRVTGPVAMKRDHRLDYGALLPVKAFKVGTQVPGQIKATFNRANAGTAQRIRESVIIEYSKAVYNELSNENYYEISHLEGNLLDNLPDFDLEELVIAFIQIKYNYYVLSNSIARKSTTIKVECEFLSRNTDQPKKAIVQVKGRKAAPLDALQFIDFLQDGYEVFLYAPTIVNAENLNNLVVITPSELLEFYHQYKAVLPASITQWEKLY
ncbi:ribonuclease D [Streptococcus suis]|uniref:Ribonuclease D n=1 Tax=Streptococcus suivaginalis TaxID=3028082 RepID=A0AA96VRB2_9STRE|nr:ribonuclease D [Streptococcus sp. 29896]MCK4027764.1 ribonuclease D [Streptococcus suis]WNY46860.1 ribonuclease D [Streptococcus sp. 29896]